MLERYATPAGKESPREAPTPGLSEDATLVGKCHPENPETPAGKESPREAPTPGLSEDATLVGKCHPENPETLRP